MYWYAIAFSSTPEKQPHTLIPPPSNCIIGTVQSGQYRSAGNCQTQTGPSKLPNREAWFITPENTSPESSGGLICITAASDERLGCSCSAIKTQSMKLYTCCFGANLKVTQSLKVWRYKLCRKLTRYVNCVSQHELTPPCYFNGGNHFVAEFLLFSCASTLIQCHRHLTMDKSVKRKILDWTYCTGGNFYHA